MARIQEEPATAGSTAYESEPEGRFFIRATKHSLETLVNNVESKPLQETAGTAKPPRNSTFLTTQH